MLLLAVLIIAGAFGSALEPAIAADPWINVTGDMDLSELMRQYLSSSVMSSSQTKKYETRTVIVSLSGEGLVELAGDASVSDYTATPEGAQKKAEIYASQDALLASLDGAGIEYELEYRYAAIDNAVAIEVNTRYVSDIRKLANVESVVIARSYAVPSAVGSGSGEAVTNVTNVYGTGIYDSSGALSSGLDGKGMVVAILDTGIDYTHTAFAVSNFWTSDDGNEQLGLNYSDIARILGENTLRAEERQLLAGSSLTASNVYVSTKIPFAYDYADNDADVYPSYSNHGTHVAGIVAGYDPGGYTDKDGNPVDEAFWGVAPNAQLVICKVFTDDLESSDLGGAETEDILAALEDCIYLGVDVINMSLGTTCGFSTWDDGDDEGKYLNTVYNAIGNSGISLVCAASNDYSSGYGGVFGTNLSSNPDSGTVGSPSTFWSALSVASISGKKSNYLKANGSTTVFFEDSNDENSNPFDFVKSMLDGKSSAEFEYVVIPGVGLASDYTASIRELVKGRVAVVKRGDSTFKEKVEIAMSYGAIGIIIYNNVSGSVRMSLGDVEDPIPAISVTMNSGAELVSGATGRVGKIELNVDYKAGPFMSDFSSWGCTPDLKLKPEITAHGGEITSTVPGGYGEMSGTSMACPNMAGVVTLLRSYVKSKWPTLSSVEVTRRINQLLMSTATTVYDRDGLPYSPRKQGSGLGSLDNSRTTLAFLWSGDASIDYRPKAELGDDKDKTGVYTFSFNLTNFGDESLSFKTKSLFMTETLSMDGLTVAEQAYMLDDVATEWIIDDVEHSDGDVIEIAARADARITVTVKLSEAEKRYIDSSFENGMFVEGFAQLVSETDGQCDLALPFMGFYGDWTKAPMLDYDVYELAKYEQDSSILEDEKPQASVWATQAYITYYNDEYIVPMGSFLYLQDEDADQVYADEEHNAISCYNQYYGDDDINNYLTTYKFKGLYAGLLRNARSVDYKLVNAVTGEVLESETAYCIGKAYAGGGSATPAYIELDIDPVKLDMASGDQYTMTFEFYLDYGDGSCEKNTYSFSFYVDYEAPVLEDVRVRYYDYKDGNKTKQRIYLDIDVFDNHYAQSVMLTYLEDGELKLATEYVTPIYNANKNGTTTVSIEITDIYDKYKDGLYVQLDDYALNHSVYWLNLSSCNQSLAPEQFTLASGEGEIELNVFETHTVKLEYSGDGNLSNFNWNSNNRSVADVKNGEIVGLAPGTAEITVTGSGGVRQVIRVTVKDAENKLPVPSISFGPIQDGEEHLTKARGTVEMYPGSSFKLDVVTDPWYYPLDRLTLKWESTNPSIATVDSEGNVQTLAKGSTVIKAVIMADDGTATAYAATVSVKVLDPFVVNNNTLTEYHGVGGVVEIPTDKNIMMISEGAFEDNDNITEIIIPKTVTAIGKDAFKNCTALKAVYFVSKEPQAIADADISVIYQCAFSGCEALELFDLSNVKALTVGRECFSGCTSLREIRSMTKLGTVLNYAFAGCTSLTSLDLTGLHVCGVGAFSGCTSLEEIKTARYSKLGDLAFYGCTSLKSVRLSAAEIGAYAFSGCSSLRNVIIEPGEGDTSLVSSIGKSAFAGCGSLVSFTCKGGVKILSIGDGAFADTSLTSFTVPDGLEALGDGILAGTPMTELVIGDEFDFEEITLLGAPFTGLDISLKDGCTKYAIKDGVLYNASLEKLLLVLKGTTSVDIPSSVESIGDHAFDGSAVTSVTIPSGVKSLGAYVFANSSLRTVIFDAGCQLTAIPEYAFYGSKLSAVTVPASVKSIGAYAFADTLITSVGYTEDSKLLEIGNGAFASCVYLESVTLPDCVRTMGELVFSGCISLTEAHMPSVSKLGAYTFYGCDKLVSVSFGDAATAVGDHTFYGCSALTDVSLGGALKEIGEGTFYGCTSLGRIDLGNVVTVGNTAFAECVALSEVKGIDRLVTIGDMAFYDCNSIKTLTLTSAKYIGMGAFAIENGGSAYNSLSIPSAVSIGNMAFFGGKEKNVEIPSTLTSLGYGAFASSKYLRAFTVAGECADFFVLDGVLFEYISDTEFELSAYPGGRGAEGDTYTVPDGTVRIANYAFNALGKDAPGKVVLPWSLREIGVSAFYESGIKDYTFMSINAPTLGSVYRDDVVEMMKAAVEDATADKIAINGLFYANFDQLMVLYTDLLGGKSELVMHCPENGVGYGNYVYSTYFGKVVSLGILIDDNTRSAVDAIEALPGADEISGWLNWEVNATNKAKLEELIENVKRARRLYGNITGEQQLAFVGSELTEKLVSVETVMRELKTKFSIPLVISDIRYNDGYKKEYTEGESFDTTGLVLTIVYDDGSTEIADLSRLTLVYPDGTLTQYDAEVRFSYRYGDGAGEVKTVRLPIKVTSGGEGGSSELPGDQTEGDGSSTVLVIVIVAVSLIVVAGGAFAAVMYLRKKKGNAAPEAAKSIDGSKPVGDGAEKSEPCNSGEAQTNADDASNEGGASDER